MIVQSCSPATPSAQPSHTPRLMHLPRVAEVVLVLPHDLGHVAEVARLVLPEPERDGGLQLLLPGFFDAMRHYRQLSGWARLSKGKSSTMAVVVQAGGGAEEGGAGGEEGGDKNDGAVEH